MRLPPFRHHRHRRLLVYEKSRIVWQQKAILSPTDNTTYYLCPKCGILLRRDFVQYCDQCGQRLNWRIVAAQSQTHSDHL